MENDNIVNPDKIAQIIFNNKPCEKCSNRMLIPYNGENLIDFEIILTIFMEGLMIIYNNLDEINIEQFSFKYLTYLNLWLNSLGYHIIIHENVDQLYLQNYYCKILLKIDEINFQIYSNQTTKNYIFLLNRNFDNLIKNKFEDIYSIFIANKCIYKIKFIKIFN
jgi:hypothetical protein